MALGPTRSYEEETTRKEANVRVSQEVQKRYKICIVSESKIFDQHRIGSTKNMTTFWGNFKANSFFHKIILEQDKKENQNFYKTMMMNLTLIQTKELNDQHQTNLKKGIIISFSLHQDLFIFCDNY